MGLSDRKKELSSAIERAQRELARLESMPDFETLADGSVVALTISYGPSRPYPVIAYKGGENWYLTGKNSPNKVSSDALAEWLSTGGRTLRGAAVVAEFTVETVDAYDITDAMLAALSGGSRIQWESTYDESSGRGL